MGKRILIIEDEENIAKVLSLNLSLNSYDVYIAETAESGLKMVYDLKPDLLLLDIRLDHVNGLDICRKIKSDLSLKYIYVIVLLKNYLK